MSTSDLLNAVHNGQCWPCMKIIETHKGICEDHGLPSKNWAACNGICSLHILLDNAGEIAGFNQMAAMLFSDSACAASEMQPLASHDVPQSMAPKTATLPEIKCTCGQESPHLCLWVCKTQACMRRMHADGRHHQPENGRSMPLIPHRGPVVPMKAGFNWHLILPPRPKIKHQL